jgi:hypothetical protein
MPVHLNLQSAACYGEVTGYKEDFDADWVSGNVMAALRFHATGKLPSLSVRLNGGRVVLGNNDHNEAGGMISCRGHTRGPWPVRALEQCKFLMDHDVRFADHHHKTLFARIKRFGDAGTSGCWKPPLILSDCAVVVTEAQIAAAYDDVQRFIDSFEGHYEKDGQILVWRGLELIHKDDAWLRLAYAHNGLLARFAKPSLTEYNSGAGVKTWHRHLFFDEGTPALQFVAYLEDTKTVVYSGHLAPDQHPLPREYKLFKQLTRRKRDSDGRQVDEVQIHFFTEAMALREKRPLLDIGCRVFFEDPSAPNGVREVEDPC